ncbi:MAG: 2-amino-4-hydroxy-6-hydroxymethyldihydropteridine diphosphokinase [Jatrophihabitantaceae bacterium]
MSTCVYSIGSNQGDRLARLQGAVELLRPWLVAVSRVYQTPPWGPVPQDDYLNAIVVASDRSASASVWLDRAHAAEQGAGRTREVRWGPRTLDVDVIDVDGLSCEDPVLTLPHPRARERAFVLVPWADVQPEAALGTRPIAELLAELPTDEVAAIRPRPDLELQ